MKPFNRGQIVKFHTPFEDEDPEQLYLVFEVNENPDRTRVQITPLQTDLQFPPINTVFIEDLEIDEIISKNLIDYQNNFLNL